MSIPTGLAFYVISFQGFVTAENILDSAGHNVVDARDPIGRWRAFIENIGRMMAPVFEALFKNAVLRPEVEHLVSNASKAKLFIFRIFIIHLKVF
jgi:hypothetical protein